MSKLDDKWNSLKLQIHIEVLTILYLANIVQGLDLGGSALGGIFYMKIWERGLVTDNAHAM